SLARYRKANSRIVRRAFREAQKLTEDVLRESFAEGERTVENEMKRLFGTERRAAYEVTGEIRFPIDEKPRLMIPDYEPGKVPYEQLPRARPETQFFGVNERKLEALQ